MSFTSGQTHACASHPASVKTFRSFEACSLPGASLSATMSTTAPLSASVWMSSQCPAPPGIVVATYPNAISVSASFSPSTTQIGVPESFAARTAGRL